MPQTVVTSNSLAALDSYRGPIGEIDYVRDTRLLAWHDGATKGGIKMGTAALLTAGTSSGQVPTADQIPSLAFVTGMILMWSGLQTTIPTGWALCDGTNGTPNLINRFVVGAGNVGSGGLYVPGDSGGSLNGSTGSSGIHQHSGLTDVAPNHAHYANTDAAGVHTHSSSVSTDAGHNHTFTAAIDGTHSHTVGVAQGLGQVSTGFGLQGGSLFYDGLALVAAPSTTLVETNFAGLHNHSGSTTDGGGSHNHSVTINGDGSHIHSATTQVAGSHFHVITSDSSGAHTHTVTLTPPYYALCMIMKL